MWNEVLFHNQIEKPHKLSAEELQWNFDGEHFIGILHRLVDYKKRIKQIIEEPEHVRPIIVSEDGDDVWSLILTKPFYKEDSLYWKDKNEASLRQMVRIAESLPKKEEQEANLFRLVSLVRSTVDQASQWKAVGWYVMKTYINENGKQKENIVFIPEIAANF